MLADYNLFAFDLDGTLIDIPDFSWNLVHESVGIAKGVRKERYRQFRAGELSYDDWVKEDIADWKRRDIRYVDFVTIFSRIRPIDGAVDFINYLKQSGKRVVLISGSIDVARKIVLPDTIFDMEFINALRFSKDGRILSCTSTGYDFEGKIYALEKSAKTFCIPMEKTVFIGNSDNDYYVLRQAGLGVAFNSLSKKLKSVAKVIINSKDMSDVKSVFLKAAPRPRHKRGLKSSPNT